MKLKKKSYTSSWSKSNADYRKDREDWGNSKYAPKGLDGWDHVDNSAHNTYCPEGVDWGSPEHLNFNKTNGKQVSLWDDTRDSRDDRISDEQGFETCVSDIISFLTKLITVDVAFKKDQNQDFTQFLVDYGKKYINMTSVDKDMYKKYMCDNVSSISQSMGMADEMDIHDLLSDSINFLDDGLNGIKNSPGEFIRAIVSDLLLDYLNDSQY